MILILIFLAIVSLGLLFWQISNLISIIFGSPPVMMEKKIIIEALKLANVKKDETFYDLGCGNGDVLIEAAKLGVKATGFEISPYYFLLAKLRTLNNGNIQVRYQNIYSADLSKADVVYCYLLPKILNKIKFHSKNRIISIGFPIRKLVLIKKSKIEAHAVFIYKTSQ